MGVIAVLAAAAAACFGAAIGGVTVGPWTLPIVVYALCLAPGVVAAVRWPTRPAVRLPRWTAIVGGRSVDLAPLVPACAAVLVALVLLRANPSVAAVIGLLVLGVVPLSLLWPRPGPLGASVVLSGMGLLGPRASLADKPALVVGLVAASAVALVARSRLATDLLPRFGSPAVDRQRQVLAAGAALSVMALAAGLLAATLVPPSASSRSDGSRPGSGGRGRARAPAPSEGAGPAEPGGIPYQTQLDVSPPEPSPSKKVVLRVDAPVADVWRTQTFDEWDGHSWHPTAALRSEHWEEPAPDDGASWVSSAGFLLQRFTVEAPSLGVLAAAPVPDAAVASSPLRRDAEEGYRPVPPLGRGARYYVLSLHPPRPSEAKLRADGVPDAEDFVEHLRVDATVDRVRALAAEVTSRAPTAYDKAHALETWLAANVRVTSTGPAVPEGGDLLDTVVTVERFGTAAQLASAMVLMLRSVGIPARLAIGFLPGRRDLLGREYVVRAVDAHTWVEARFDDEPSWVRFDPSGRIAKAEREDSFLARLLRLLRRLAPGLVAVGVIATGLAVWRLLAWRRRQRALPWAVRIWARLTKVGAAAGRPRLPFETPAEYTAALAAVALPDPRLHRVGSILTAATFSGGEPPPDDRAEAERVLRDAVATGRALRRRRWRRSRVSTASGAA